MRTKKAVTSRENERSIYIDSLNSSEKIILDFLFRWDRPIRAGDLSAELNIKHTTLNSQLQALENKGLIKWRRYRTISLTDTGIKLAKHLVRHHRILELLFNNLLGMTPEQAHRESVRLFPFCSCVLINKVTKVIGNVHLCPCGYPIPESADCEMKLTN